MKPNFSSVFAVTLLVSWIAFYLLVDFNVYRVSPNGTKVLKDEATTLTRVVFSGLGGLLAATMETIALFVICLVRTPTAVDRAAVRQSSDGTFV